ncbi:Os07g0115350, partial [Oryza sativa Japonica Group]
MCCSVRTPPCAPLHKGDHVGLREAVGGEERRELVEVERRRRQPPVDAARRRSQPVQPPKLHRSNREYTYQRDGVSGGHGEDVGAGDAVAASRHGVDGGLGLDDGVEAVAGEGEVVGVVLLRRVVPRRRDHHRRVAAVDEAVVEEEPHGGADGGERLLDLPRHSAADDGLHVGAHAGVVVPPELRRAHGGAARHSDQHQHRRRR